MQRQGRNLSMRIRGEDVALLQTELAQLRDADQLDAIIDPDEVGRQFFGPTMRDAVVRFQQQHGLRPAGIVEAETARLINAEVNALRGGAEASVVRGQIHRDGRPCADVLVRVNSQRSDCRAKNRDLALVSDHRRSV
jgi:murein L,D-transpeptidase YcbB/YkuD